MVCTRFTLVNTLVLTVELHGKRMVMYYYFYHGISHFALQLLHGKPPLVICRALQLCLRSSATLAQSTVGSACRRREVCVQSSVALGLQRKVLEFSGL